MTAAQSSVEALRIAARAAEEKQGTNLFAVDASDAMGLIDGFLVVSAHNERLVNAVADEVEDALREQAGLKPVRREGRSSGRWILLDFGDIVVHVQHEEDREFYALDRLWAQARASSWVLRTRLPSISRLSPRKRPRASSRRRTRLRPSGCRSARNVFAVRVL